MRPGQDQPEQYPQQLYGQQQPYGQQPYPPQQPYGQVQPQPYKSVSKERGLSAKSHTFHLIATICTCGVWGLFVWLPLWVFRMIVRRKKTTRHYYQ
jgi:hypothetical protein